MWFFIFIFMLRINTCLAAGQKNSTQMYYSTLTIDRSVLEKIRQSLSGFFVTNSSLNIENLEMTTICKENTCMCESGYSWSEDICRSNPLCCGQTSCSFSGASSQSCSSNSTVRVAGTITMSGPTYQTCLTDKTSVSFETCNKNMTTEIKNIYTTIKGFNTLTINSYSLGSIIVNFGMTIVADLKSQDLIDRSVELSQRIQGSIELQTTGLVSLTVPNGKVQYHSSTILTCSMKEDLGAKPVWKLKKDDNYFLITKGTVSTVTFQKNESTVKLNKVDELWEGEYICLFVQKSDKITIYHKANASMDICIIPTIRTYTNPAFPLCRKSDDVLLVNISCEIDKTNENYTVTWSDHAIPGTYILDERTQTYKAQKVISCVKDNTEISTKAEAWCSLTNSCNQTVKKLFDFTIIQYGDKYCEAEDEWQNTKLNYTANIKCTNQAGVRKRFCKGAWDLEVLECVNQELHDVLQFAMISDTGLGEVDANAAEAFFRFHDITKTAKLDTVANVHTSVSVLQTLNSKIQSLVDVNAVDNFLSSSSNLLNETLESSWNSTTSNGNSSMADTYLISVEELLKKANISEKIKKANIEVVGCSNGTCDTVFNVSLSVSNSSKLKIAGFKFLQKYLSSRDNTTEPNSIVVSATTEEKKVNPEVLIDFKLINERPRNVKLTCVFRETNETEWSSKECIWAGPNNEQRCTCYHLSSFTILISKEPLKVPWLDEITYIGLGISVLSLFIGLLIELVVWKDVVKTNTLHLRHTAHVNISLCLLVGDACFLASSEKGITDVWCRTSAVLKHFCYLAMFFWMLCLSSTLLHQAVFLFHKVSKTNYLRFSLVLGYGCPLIIVFVTFLTNNAGSEGMYYSRDTCWLVYQGLFRGSIYTFIIPVYIIVFINVFSMLVVIMKLLSHHQNADTAQEKEKAAAKTVLRSVILLTPIFGMTWIFGLAIMLIDLTSGVLADIINYTFVVLNAFQGLFILLTSYLADRKTREALMKRFRKKAPVSSMNESTTSTTTTTKLESLKK